MGSVDFRQDILWPLASPWVIPTGESEERGSESLGAGQTLSAAGRGDKGDSSGMPRVLLSSNAVAL